MYKDLDEPISVIAVFERGDLRPLRFYWQDRAFRVDRVTGRWRSPKGDCCIRHFSAVESGGHVFHLTYDERSTRWAISKVWVEEANSGR